MSKAPHAAKKRFSIASDRHGHPLCRYIFDDEFHWDASLEISGNFGSIEERNRYARAICDALNDAAERIPRE